MRSELCQQFRVIYNAKMLILILPAHLQKKAQLLALWKAVSSMNDDLAIYLVIVWAVFVGIVALNFMGVPAYA